jgi:hypothetical protein
VSLAACGGAIDAGARPRESFNGCVLAEAGAVRRGEVIPAWLRLRTPSGEGGAELHNRLARDIRIAIHR